MSESPRPLEVLIIDDNKVDRSEAKREVQDVFRGTRIIFTEAETRASALESLGKRFDLIICDGCLNRFDTCDGDQVVAKAREGNGANVKSAIVARSSSDRALRAMASAGADAGIGKDTDLDDDKDTFAKVVGGALLKAAKRDPEGYKGLEDLLRQAEMKTTPIPGNS